MSKCSYCGTEDETVRTHSNREECSRCWNYRKLDRPAALHWARVAAEYLSNVDMYDVMTYLPASGLTKEEMHTMLVSARRVEVHSRYLNEHGAPHRWTEAVKEQYEAEMAKTR